MQKGPARKYKDVCDGCVYLRTEYWKDYLDNDETDSGTTATCTLAKRVIDTYWHSQRETPTWCPAKNKHD